AGRRKTIRTSSSSRPHPKFAERRKNDEEDRRRRSRPHFRFSFHPHGRACETREAEVFETEIFQTNDEGERFAIPTLFRRRARSLEGTNERTRESSSHSRPDGKSRRNERDEKHDEVRSSRGVSDGIRATDRIRKTEEETIGPYPRVPRISMNPYESAERKNIPAVLVSVFSRFSDGKERVLMIHRDSKDRPIDFHAGKWNGLGGKCEKDESYRECAARELFEESTL